MIQPIGRFLFAACIVALPSMSPRAQGTQEPSLITIPSIPVANQSFKVKATFFGPTTPCLYLLGDYVGFGQPGLILIDCDIAAPRQIVTQEVIIPGQHAGPYEVDFASPGFSPRPVYATFTLTVADAPLVAISAMTTVGAGTCAALLALFGIFGSRRRRKLLTSRDNS